MGRLCSFDVITINTSTSSEPGRGNLTKTIININITYIVPPPGQKGVPTTARRASTTRAVWLHLLRSWAMGDFKPLCVVDTGTAQISDKKIE